MCTMIFEDYRQMSDYIKAHGPLPTDKEVRVAHRIILPGRVKDVSVAGRSSR